MVRARRFLALSIPFIFVSGVSWCVMPEIRVVALVESRAPAWKQIPASARIDVQGLSFKRKVYLEGRTAIPVKAPEVRKALVAALKTLSKEDRLLTREVLKAIEEWTADNLTETGGVLTVPSTWRSAAEVLKEKSGNRFELVRAITAMLRAAGIPARPSFNGLPMVSLFVVPARGYGFWTVWDPFHPSASLTRLPVLWLPLRAEEVALVSTRPVVMCEPGIEGRRYISRAEAEMAFATLKTTGVFPSGDVEPLSADAKEWWEVWAVGAIFTGSIEKTTTVTFPLPFVIEPQSRCGTREWGIWTSGPVRLKGKPSAHTRTDQQLGGILMDVRMDIRPMPVSATTGA